MSILLGLLGDFWPYIAGAAGIIAVYVTGRRDGGKKAKSKMKEADHANAAEIRDRVDRGRDERVRELDGQGYRD